MTEKQGKKILVVSHERSGTHFLINSLCNTYKDIQSQTGQSNCLNVTSFGSLEETRTIEQNIVFKDHSHFSRYESKGEVDYLKNNFVVLYAIRDVRDVMSSMFVYFKRNPKAFYSEGGFSDFLNLQKIKEGEDEFCNPEFENMIHRWQNHVTSWFSQSEVPIEVVRYENLYVNYRQQMDKIDLFLREQGVDMTTVPNIELEKPDMHSGKNYNVSPNKGKIGDWKEYMPEDFGIEIRKHMHKIGLQDYIC